MTAEPDEAGGPAEDFGKVWELLDALPVADASAGRTATTLEMVAIDLAGRHGPGIGPQPDRRRWLGPAAAVVAALVTGVVAGWATAPDSEATLLEALPIVQRLDLLQEAGTVTFLAAVAKADVAPPLRGALLQTPEQRERLTRDYLARVDALGKELVAVPISAEVLEERRDAVRRLSLDDRIALERNVQLFAALSPTERRSLAATAAALVDPARPELRRAALLWHQWVAGSRPEEQADMIAMGTEKRLDMLQWYATRREFRPGERPPGERFSGDRLSGDRERRGPGGFPPPGGPPPEPPPREPDRRGPPFRPPGGPRPPGETPPPPR
jgi:hypothetical protein